MNKKVLERVIQRLYYLLILKENESLLKIEEEEVIELLGENAVEQRNNILNDIERLKEEINYLESLK
jgi:hypothetical protein